MTALRKQPDPAVQLLLLLLRVPRATADIEKATA